MKKGALTVLVSAVIVAGVVCGGYSVWRMMVWTARAMTDTNPRQIVLDFLVVLVSLVMILVSVYAVVTSVRGLKKLRHL